MRFPLDPAAHGARFSIGPSSGAAVGGHLPCGYAGCMRDVDLSQGSYFCPEHRPASPRAFIDGRGQPRHLDHELADAEKRLTRARSELDQFEAEANSLKAQVAAFDGVQRVSNE
jgi:hypothetical protein